jgi:hypothetical protein
MGQQVFADLSARAPLLNLAAVTATVETQMWNPAQYSPIAANEAYPGKLWRLNAGGIVTLAATGNMLVTPRFGLSVAAGISMGPNTNAVTVPGVVTNAPWYLEMMILCRTVGLPGANSTVIGHGTMGIAGLGTAGQAINLCFGGTQATVDVSVATAICMGWTLSVAGSLTVQNVVMQPLN